MARSLVVQHTESRSRLFPWFLALSLAFLVAGAAVVAATESRDTSAATGN
jgi:hypothetical protein